MVFDIVPAGANCVKIRNVKSGLFVAIDQNGDIMTKVGSRDSPKSLRPLTLINSFVYLKRAEVAFLSEKINVWVFFKKTCSP